MLGRSPTLTQPCMLGVIALSLAFAGGDTTTGFADAVLPAPRAGDTVFVATVDSSFVVGGTAVRWMTLRAPSDTGRPQPVELSDWYYRRNTIHRVAAYTMIPLFVAQYVSGRRVYTDLADAPEWARTTHRAAATGTAALFTVNTVTGVWNLWEGRHVTEGRGRRLAHSVLMLAADAGFVYTGVLAERAEDDVTLNNRRLHRSVALTSVGVAVAGYLVMLIGDR